MWRRWGVLGVFIWCEDMLAWSLVVGLLSSIACVDTSSVHYSTITASNYLCRRVLPAGLHSKLLSVDTESPSHSHSPLPLDHCMTFGHVVACGSSS